MKYVCDDCGFVTEEEELRTRLAREEDGVPRGERVSVCPHCGSIALFEYKGKCEDCWFCNWDAVKEMFKCGNEKSNWYGEELNTDNSCPEWEEV